MTITCPPNKDLCFLVTTYKEIELCIWTLSNIREHHPNSEIICLSDGVDYYSNYSSFFIERSVLYKEGPHLKTIDSGGLWIGRYLSTYLTLSNAKYLIKLDPDTGVHRSIRSIPSTEIFGSFSKNYMDSSCMGMSRSAVSLIVTSDLLSQPIYNKENKFTYKDRYKRLRPSTDRALRDVIRRLGIGIGVWNEVRTTSTYQPNLNLTYALTHPNSDLVL